MTLNFFSLQPMLIFGQQRLRDHRPWGLYFCQMESKHFREYPSFHSLNWLQINVRENRRANQEWTNPRNWEHMVQVEDKQCKKHNTEN